MLRPRKTARSSSPKSSPMTAMRSTSVKNDAATEKYVAEPPRQRSALPKGVWMESNATVPTTRMDIVFLLSSVFAHQRRDRVFPLRRNVRRIRDHREPQRIRAGAVARAGSDARDGVAQHALGHCRVRAEVTENLLHRHRLLALVP